MTTRLDDVGNPEVQLINENVNELVNNIQSLSGQGQNIDEETGRVTSLDTSGNEIFLRYLYRYLHTRYATDENGSGFTDDYTAVNANNFFQGVRNSNDLVESTNPADYIWTEIQAGGIPAYRTLGGRQVDWTYIANTPPGYNVDDRSSSVDLDSSPGSIQVDIINTSNNGNAFFQGTGGDKVYRATVSFNGTPFTDAEHNIFRYDWTVNGTAVLSGIGMRSYTVTSSQITNINELQVDCVVTCE